MSSPRTRRLAFGLASLLAVPLQAAAQQRTEQELVQHLDTLVPLLQPASERAQAAKRAYFKAIESRIATDTVRIGPLEVLVLPGEEAAARDVVGRIWIREYAPWLDTSPALSRSGIFFHWANGDIDYRSASLFVRNVQGSSWRSRRYMEAGVRRAIGEFLKGDLIDTRLGTEWTVPSVGAPVDPGDIYRRVASVPSKSSRACLGGDAGACLTSFGLGSADIPLGTWYTPEERRLLVKRNQARFEFRGGVECIEGDYAACDRALDGHLQRYARWDRGLWAMPFDGEVRGSLLWYALVQGGEGAWDRLLQHRDDAPLATLEAVSGLSGTELVAGWRRWLLENRPTRQAGLGSVALGVLFWTTLLIALAARSTRWRLG